MFKLDTKKIGWYLTVVQHSIYCHKFQLSLQMKAYNMSDSLKWLKTGVVV